MKFETDTLHRIVEMPGDRFGVRAACKDGNYGVSVIFRAESAEHVTEGFIAEADIPAKIERLSDPCVRFEMDDTWPGCRPRMIELIRIAAAEIPRLREKGAA